MATPQQIATLRRMIAEPISAEPYTDNALQTRIDQMTGTLRQLASEIWYEKAAASADLVDITEAGSSRKNSNLQGQALAMAATFAQADPTVPTVALGASATTRPIERA